MNALPNCNLIFRVLGVRVNAIQIRQVIALMESWIEERNRTRYIAVTGMHGIAESLRDGYFRVTLESADLVVPDGMPLIWLGRYYGFPLQRRVYGPELMESFLKETGPRYRHFFYGGVPGVADQLAELARRKYGIQVAGTYCPPFRPLTAEEDRTVIHLIEKCAPDVLWVGLSTPKQERWMHMHRETLRVPVMLGVGAAFDINAGTLRQAPTWMRENGLEWLFRLLAEPYRLCGRYVVQGSCFIWNVCLELLGLKQFATDSIGFDGLGGHLDAQRISDQRKDQK